eukprot:5094198-Alexandrium_andersonii.AAC.1
MCVRTFLSLTRPRSGTSTTIKRGPMTRVAGPMHSRGRSPRLYIGRHSVTRNLGSTVHGNKVYYLTPASTVTARVLTLAEGGGL